MPTLDDLPDDWVVWNDEPGGQSIVVYRPDVFDSTAFPASCLPTLTVSRTDPRRRGPPGSDTGRGWYVALYLEPDVRVKDLDGEFPSRTAAVENAVSVADAFADGEVDYRAAYQLPEEEYLAKLDDLTGREP
ncbi:DUF5820 family protein [Halobacteriaceae archaeon GCM10025711]